MQINGTFKSIQLRGILLILVRFIVFNNFYRISIRVDQLNEVNVIPEIVIENAGGSSYVFRIPVCADIFL